MPNAQNNNRAKPTDRRQTGQGRVKDPQFDGRLKDNRERGIRKSNAK